MKEGRVLFKLVLCLMAAYALGIMLEAAVKGVTGAGRRYTRLLSMAVTVMYLGAYGMGWGTLPHILFGQALLFAAEHDRAFHIVPDYIPVWIFATGLTGMQPVRALAGMVFVPLPLFVAALSDEGSIGGGDIKLMAACGFVLGAPKGYAALAAGLLLAVLCETLRRRRKRESFALAPYLAAGCLMADLPVL